MTYYCCRADFGKHEPTCVNFSKDTIKLYLDDMRYAPDDTWCIVRNFKQFCDFIKEYGVPDTISFDHDLGNADDLERTGYDCADWLMAHYQEPKHVIVHSFNPAGARRIAQVFEKTTATVLIEPAKVGAYFR